MSGTIENPLFDAKQIIETILGYKKLNDCRFYRDNKSNQDFIQIGGNLAPIQNGIKGLENQDFVQTQVGGETTPIYKYHKNADTIYLTEFGLYECLFASNKPIASKFRLSVMILLKDIRIGNLKLLVEKECETTKLLEQKESALLSYISMNSNLEEQLVYIKQELQSTQKKLAMGQEDVFIYEIEIDGKIYRGSALDVLNRIKQHMSKSSNKHIRRAQSQGQNIICRLIHKQTVNNRHERNQVERAFIQQIPADKRLNLTIPRVRESSLVSNECIQELEQALDRPISQSVPIVNSRSRRSSITRQINQPILQQEETKDNNLIETITMTQSNDNINDSLDLTVILEESKQRGKDINYSLVTVNEHIAYIQNNDIDVEFKDKINAIHDFYAEHQFTPRDSDKVTEWEHSLGRFLVKLRNVYRYNNTAHYDLSTERYAYILHKMPCLLQDDNQPFYNRVLQLKTFISANNRLPKQRGQNNGSEEETKLYDWLAHRRTDFKEGNLEQCCVAFFNEQLPTIQFVIKDADSNFTNKLKQLKVFIDKYGKYPTQKEDKLLQSFVRDIQTAEQKDTKSRVKMTQSRKQMINLMIPNFPW